MIRYALLVSALLTAAPRPVFTDNAVTLLGAPSPDGRYVSLVENGNLAVRDVASGRSTRLTSATGPEFAYFSSISRDSKTIAYAWFNAEGFYELRSVPIGGGASRTLFKNPEAGFVQPTAWTPDNKFILTLLFRKDNVSQIALIPASGGEARILRSLNWVYPKRMDISPDGQTLIYDSFAPGSTSERTIYSLAIDGTAEKRLVPEPGNHLFPLFTPDGKSIIYLSGNDLVLRPLEGSPKVVQAGLGRALPLGITARGEIYYGLRTGASDVFLADIANITASARRVSIRFPNRNLAPSFSPDGKRLAYLSRRGTENFGQESRAVVVRDLSGDGEEEAPVRMAHIERVQWRSDGQALLLAGSDGRGRGGIFEYDLATRRTRPLVAEIGGPPKGYEFYPSGNTPRPSAPPLPGETRPAETAPPALRDEGARANTSTPDSSGTTLRAEVAVPAKGLMYLDGATLRDQTGQPIGPASSLPALLAGFPVAAEGVTEWLPSAAALFGVRGGTLLRFSRAGTGEFHLPGNRQPGAAISPDGKTIALTAGREKQEIWVLKLHENAR